MKRDAVDVGNLSDSTWWIRPLVGVAVAGVGCLGLFYLRGKLGRRVQVTAIPADNLHFSENLDSAESLVDNTMGQSESMVGSFVQSSGDYQQLPTDDYSMTANQTCRITVNPQNDLQLTFPTPDECDNRPIDVPKLASAIGDSKATHKFKKVVCRSRVDSDSVQTNDGQAESSATEPNNTILMGNYHKSIGLASKGFSAIDFHKSLTDTLDNLYNHSRPMSPTEARSLALILDQNDTEMLLKALVAISNLAAFTSNQELLRQAGVLDRMVQLLEDPRLSESANVMLLQSLSNMALNVNNQKSSKRRCLPLLIARLRQPRCSELEKMTSFRALLNYTTEIDGTDAETLIPLIPTLYSRVSTYHGQHCENFLLVLRLLVNLSCSSHLTLYLLAAEAPTDFLTLLDPTAASEAVLLRIICFVNNLSSAVTSMRLTDKDLPIQQKAAAPFTVFALLFGLENSTLLRSRLSGLHQYPNDEISQKSAEILIALRAVSG